MTHEWTHFRPIRGVADIVALEAVPLDQRITSWDINAWARRGRWADPEKVALTYYPAGDPAATPDTMTYRELDARVSQVANLFHALGVGRDDAVVLLGPTLPDSYTVILAALARGIVCCVNWMLPPEHVADLIVAARAKVVVALGPMPGFQIWDGMAAIQARIAPATRVLSFAAPGGTVLPDSDLLTQAATQPSDRLLFADAREADDVVAYVHSGGTTGAPKLVRLTSRGIVHKCWTVTTTMAHRPEDVLFSDMPMFHIAGLLSCGILPVVLGAALVIPTPMGARDKVFIGNFWKFVERCRISFLHAVPTTLGVLAQHPPQGEDVRSLHDYATTGSAALPIDVAQRIEANPGIRLLMTYGATEFTQNVTQAPRDGDPRYGSAGIRNPDTEIRIVALDAAGRVLHDCATDEIGAVLVRSPGNTQGYVDPRDDGGIFLDGGWINNGDLGRLDADGYLWLTGRAKDLIIRGGHNIDPAIIESALRRHPAVAAAAAVGMPDAYAGEVPVAYVQLAEGQMADAQELQDFARANVSERAASPREVFILPELPLTDVRKIAKAELRQDAIRRAFERALRAALGVDVTVGVVPDRTHGLIATIRLVASDTAQQSTLTRRIEAALAPYTVRTKIMWTGGTPSTTI